MCFAHIGDWNILPRMKPHPAKIVSTVLPFAAFVVVLMLAIQSTSVSQAPQGGGATPAPGAPPAGGRGGRGGGGARGTPLGDGPWDVGEGEDRIHVTVVTKGLDHPWGMA